MTTLADYTPQNYRWLVKDFLLANGVNVIVGAPGSSKGTLCAAFGKGVTDQGKSVILISPEDRAETTLAGRYIASGADRTRVHDMSHDEQGNTFQLPDGLPDLEQKVKETRAGLVIIDGINACTVTMPQTQQWTRFVMDKLEALAWADGKPENQCAIILIAHNTKDGKQVAGSSAWVEAARIVLQIKVHDDVRQLSVRKSNISQPNGSYYYVIDGTPPRTRVRWLTTPQVRDWERQRHG